MNYDFGNGFQIGRRYISARYREAVERVEDHRYANSVARNITGNDIAYNPTFLCGLATGMLSKPRDFARVGLKIVFG